MSFKLCSNELNSFIDAIATNSCSEKQLLDKMNEVMPAIADRFNIARAIISLSTQTTVFELHKTDKRNDFTFADYDHRMSPITFDYVIGDNGNANGKFYPVLNHEFTEDEQEDIDRLFRLIIVFYDRARLSQLVTQATSIDPLTGVPNVTAYMSFGAKLFAQAMLQNYTGIYLNVKNFKYINKCIGSRQGDQILIRFAETVQNYIHDDEVFSRLGGDNFVALIKNDRLDDFLRFVSHIKIDCGPISFNIQCRMGIYHARPNDSINDVMNYTSAALNAAKSSSKDDFVIFEQKHMDKLIHDKEISVTFGDAIDKNEFVVYYQPKVDIATNTLCGCEALVRWIKDGKIVPPMEFIPVLEAETTICKLDFYVLEKVCSDLRDWIDRGCQPVRVSCNFSKNHLSNKNLSHEIMDVLNRYGIDGSYIEIELTEMSGYENFEALSKFIKDMKDYGVCTSIDDFGTAYSSLNLLKDLDVDIIKLDKSFLSNLNKDNGSNGIVIKNIVNMVNELNMSVVAEGVETVEQVWFLGEVKCSMVQGFLYDKPLTHDDFEKRLTSERIYNIKSE